MIQEMLSDMIMLATKAHLHQYDKAGLPYILHPLEVMRILNSDDEELNCIAIGHDLVEDTSITLMELEERGFTQRVIDGIYHLTKKKHEDYDDYIGRLIKNPDAVKVKLADLTHNMDMRRLPTLIIKKDLERLTKYQFYYLMLKDLK